MVCRSKGRGEAARQKIVEASGNESVFLLVCDCSLEADTRALWKAFCKASAGAAGGGEADAVPSSPPRLDVLVCNAGVLLNEKTPTPEGVETTFACHLLFGTYLLGKLAMESLESTAGSRMVVVSSGGMYNTAFPGWDIASAADPDRKFDGQLACAPSVAIAIRTLSQSACVSPACVATAS